MRKKNSTSQPRPFQLSTRTIRRLDAAKLPAALGGQYDRKQGPTPTNLCD